MDKEEKYEKIKNISSTNTKEVVLVKSKKTNKIYIHKNHFELDF